MSSDASVCCLKVHLSPAGVNAVTVSWATQNYTVGKGYVAPLPTAGVVSLVQYGSTPAALTSVASGITEVSKQLLLLSGSFSSSLKSAKQAVSQLSYATETLPSSLIAQADPADMVVELPI